MAKVLWQYELKTKGWYGMLQDRLWFHKTLTVEMVREHTLRSTVTVRRHFQRLVDDRRAEWVSSPTGEQKWGITLAGSGKASEYQVFSDDAVQRRSL